MHPIDILVKRYPALALPIKEGMKGSEEYRRVCLRGEDYPDEPVFNKTDLDRLDTEDTPAGNVEVLYLADREDFVHAYRALAYYCEPVKIPDSTGAATLIGLNNWEKIRALDKPLDQIEKREYKDTLILLSRGGYSSISAEQVGLYPESWQEKSYTIRKYHELTHYISRNLFPDNKEAIRDEIMADMMGLIFAYGKYDVFLARLFLGIEGEEYREGGRLQNYVTGEESLSEVIIRSRKIIDIFLENLPRDMEENPFRILEKFEREKIGIL